MAVIGALSGHPALAGYDPIPVPEEEAYAANCVLVNGRVLVASGFPAFESALRARGVPVVPLDMSEFRKMDGGLSCLSLRF
jgi:dimethylargininase